MTTEKTKAALDALKKIKAYEDNHDYNKNPDSALIAAKFALLDYITAQAEAQPAEDDVREAVKTVRHFIAITSDSLTNHAEIQAIETLIRAATAPKYTEEQWLKLFKTVAARTWTPEQALEHMKEDVSVCVVTAPKTVPHTDDVAVDVFAARMKAKMAVKRADGRGGWEDKSQCTAEFLSQLLREHVDKGDPVDVANLAMMLSIRGECITAPKQTDAEREKALDAFQNWLTFARYGDCGFSDPLTRVTILVDNADTIIAALRSPAAVPQEVVEDITARMDAAAKRLSLENKHSLSDWEEGYEQGVEQTCKHHLALLGGKEE